MKKIFLIIPFLFLCFFAKAQTEVTIYGFYNTINGKHFYSTNQYEVHVGTGGWVQDAPLGNLYAPASGTAVYRYYNSDTGAHFYSTTTNPPGGFHLEGIMGIEAYPPLINYGRQQAVYGYLNPSTHDYYFSFSSTPPTGWTSIGIQFYTFPCC
ncbi:MAG TPA: hypothetical protein VIM55_06785 [Mucilaginibacter sp.]